MVKLKKPLNYKGGILEAGMIVSLGEIEGKLIANGAAERYVPASEEPKPDLKQDLKQDPKPPLEEVLQAKTKAELLDLAEQAQIEVSDKSKKDDIIQALIDAVSNGFELNLDAKDAE